MTVTLPTEHHFEFLRFKGGCTCSSESTLVKMPHCWKSCGAAHILIFDEPKQIFMAKMQVVHKYHCYSGPVTLDSSAESKINFVISQPKYVLWVFKRTISLRWFF